MMQAEELARESLRIRTLLYGSNEQIVGSSFYLLANILMTQGEENI
jgi:hypothetical protein